MEDTEEENFCERHFVETIKRNSDGRFVICHSKIKNRTQSWVIRVNAL